MLPEPAHVHFHVCQRAFLEALQVLISMTTCSQSIYFFLISPRLSFSRVCVCLHTVGAMTLVSPVGVVLFSPHACRCGHSSLALTSRPHLTLSWRTSQQGTLTVTGTKHQPSQEAPRRSILNAAAGGALLRVEAST